MTGLVPGLGIEMATEQGKAVYMYGNHVHGHITELSGFGSRIAATDAANSLPPAPYEILDDRSLYKFLKGLDTLTPQPAVGNRNCS